LEILFQNNIDDAFTRRLKFIVGFPFPDEVHRKKIWNIIFPKEVPLEDDIDYDFIAKKIKVSGGDIQLIALLTSMFAAKDNSSINMRYIMLGIRRYYQRIGRSFNEHEFRPYSYYELVREDINNEH